MNRLVLLVGLGSFVGGVCRYYSQLVITRFFSSPFPYGTFAVNVTGCFLIGLIYGFSERGNLLSPEWRLFLATGFCGGFTTFSTFSFESMNLIQHREFFYLAMYVGLSVMLGFAATYMGTWMVKSL
jgi:CrcB protein